MAFVAFQRILLRAPKPVTFRLHSRKGLFRLLDFTKPGNHLSLYERTRLATSRPSALLTFSPLMPSGKLSRHLISPLTSHSPTHKTDPLHEEIGRQSTRYSESPFVPFVVVVPHFPPPLLPLLVEQSSALLRTAFSSVGLGVV